MNEKDIVMRVKEAKRLRVIEEAIEKQMTQRKAASILGLSERQVRRVVKRVQREGPIGIIHHSISSSSFIVTFHSSEEKINRKGRRGHRETS